jgi:hypothetical protein
MPLYTRERKIAEDLFNQVARSPMTLPMPESYIGRWRELLSALDCAPTPSHTQVYVKFSPMQNASMLAMADKLGLARTTYIRIISWITHCSIMAVTEVDEAAEVQQAAKKVLECAHLLTPADRRYLREQLLLQPEPGEQK